MRDECIRAVTQAAAAAGRTLAQGDLAKIENRIRDARKILGSQNRDFARLSQEEQITQAGKLVASDILAAKRKVVVNVAEQITIHDRNRAFMEAQAAKGESRFSALRRIMAVYQDRKGNVRSQEQTRRGIMDTAMRGLQGVADVTQKYLGFWTNKEGVRDFVREGMGQDTGNAAAKAAWKTWESSAESLRQQFNAAGGAMRKLAYGYVPQKWDWYKTSKVNAHEFIADMLPRLRREHYVNPDGTPMSDSQLTPLLAEFHRTISTDGASDIKPGEQVGLGATKNRRQEQRVLHLKDADAWMDMQAKYGSGSALEAMISHINGMARDIANMKTWGPNADAGFKALLDEAEQRESAFRPADATTKDRYDTSAMYDVASGKVGAIASPTIARYAQNIRAVMMFKLGSSALSAISDGANVRAIARAWSIPQLRAWQYQLKAWGSADFRRDMRAQGAGVEAIGHATSRFGEEMTSHGLPMHIAQNLLRTFGLNFIDNVRRIGTGAVIMHKLGELTREHDTIPDGTVVGSRGVDPAVWQIWKKAQLDDRGMLTPAGIGRIEGISDGERQNAIQQLIGVMTADVDTVVPMPTDRTRGRTQAFMGANNFTRGTVGGEVARSLLQFKGFPLAMFGNAWQRAAGMPTPASRVLYAAEFIVTASILGAVSAQLKSLWLGQNPQDMTDPKFAGRAFVQGGALGLYGDTLNAIVSPYGWHLGDQLGPAASTVNDVTELAERKNKGAAAAGLVRGLTPEPFYLKAAMDHLIFQRLQDYYSPGYSQRTQQRSQKDYNASYFWRPSTANNVPEPQAPNLNTAVGGR